MLNKSVIWSLLIIITPNVLLSADVIPKPPEDLLSVAEKILTEKFEKSSDSYKENFSYFNEWDTLTNFRLDEPVPYFGLSINKVYELKELNDFAEALEFRGWNIPIYIGSVETEPRTRFFPRKNDDGEWIYTGMGGDSQPMYRAREKWPIKEGYKHAEIVLRNPNVILIMIENNDLLQFWYSNDNGTAGDLIFCLSKNEDGSWPVFSRDYLIGLVKSGIIAVREKPIPRQPDDPYTPCYIGIEKEYTKYEAIDKGRLNREPKILHYEMPSYPMPSRKAGIEGTAILEVLIGVDGKVENAKVIESEISPNMEKLLLDAAQKFVYRPGRRGSKSVRCKANHLISFKLNDDRYYCPLD